MGDNRKTWSEEQDHAITTLVKKHGTHRWSEISKRMADHFGPPGRTGKQCRERWNNNLNPKINKNQWTAQEEHELFKCHEKYGNKWKAIAHHLKGRTDNYIKNKFYSTIRKKLRKINKMLGMKNSTSTVKQIKPKVLSNIIDAASSNQQIGAVWGQLSQVLFYNDDKKLAKLIQGAERTRIGELIQQISNMNEKYLQKKEVKRNQKNLEKNKEFQDEMKEHKIPVRRILLRHRNKSQSQKQELKPKEELRAQQKYQYQTFDDYHFNINLAESSFVSYPSLTPGVGRNPSYESARSNQQFSLPFDICNKSPGVFTRNFSSPCQPTPGVNMTATIELKNGYELNNPQIYNDVVLSMQYRVAKETMARK